MNTFVADSPLVLLFGKGNDCLLSLVRPAVSTVRRINGPCAPYGKDSDSEENYCGNCNDGKRVAQSDRHSKSAPPRVPPSQAFKLKMAQFVRIWRWDQFPREAREGLPPRPRIHREEAVFGLSIRRVSRDLPSSAA